MGIITQKWVKLLFPFSSNYHGKFSETELAKITNTPQQSASRYLKDLINQGIVTYDTQGRNKLLYLDFSKLSTLPLMHTIESQKALEFSQKAQEATVIINEILTFCETIILFGSYATYKFDKQSDLDIVIMGKTDKNKIKSVKQKYPLQINEHYITSTEFAKTLKAKNPLATEITKNHILFGKISEIIRIMINTR